MVFQFGPMMENTSGAPYGKSRKTDPEKKKKKEKKTSESKPKQTSKNDSNSYTVKKGDTLWDIADKKMDNPTKWPEIYQKNKKTIGKDPDLIRPGQQFQLPIRKVSQSTTRPSSLDLFSNRLNGSRTENPSLDGLMNRLSALNGHKTPPSALNNQQSKKQLMPQLPSKKSNPKSQSGFLDDILHPLRTLKNIEENAQKKVTSTGLNLLGDFLDNLSHKGKVNNKTVRDSALGALTQLGVNNAAERVSHTKNKEVNRDLVRLSPLGSAANELQKGLIGKELSQYDQKNRSKAGKASDFTTDALSYLLPGSLAAKGVKAAGLGVKAGAKGLPLLGQLARQGALTGGALGGLDVATREALNGKNYSAKDNLEHLALTAGLGAVAEPLLGGTGKILKDASENTIKKLIPNSDKLGNQFAEILKPKAKNKASITSPLESIAKKPNNAPTNDLLKNLEPIKKKTSDKPLLPIINNEITDKAVEGNSKGLLPNVSESPLNGLKERGHIKTLKQSPNALDGLKIRLNGTYRPISNNETVNIANQRIDNGLEKAVSFVKSADVLKPEHVATAHRLIQEFQKSGQIDKAVDIAEHIAEQGTKAGQAVQAYSIFDRLSPEGILVHAHRVADRVNAKLGPAQAKVTITNDTANQLSDLATTVQKMTNQKTVANDVINILDKAKSGVKLTDVETKSIRQFVDDAKQFVTDIQPKKNSPKALNKIINPEVKGHVISFLDKQEAAARQRLAARKNRALSGLPVDDFYDYAVIGASKLAKGTVHFADFSEQMVREFGDEVAPYVQQIYNKASEMVHSEVKRTTNRLTEVEKITNKALKSGKLEPNDAENLRQFAVSVGKMTGDAKIEASQELQATLQALERPSLLQKVSAAQTIAQLLNPKTLARNAIGNELFYRLERINKLVATPIDWTRTKLTGGQRTITFKTNNQGEYWKNWIKGAKAGWKGVNPEGLATQYDLKPNSFTGKWNPLTYLEKVLGVSLKSFDYAGYKRAVNNTIGELATLRAMNEGLTGQAKKQAIERYIREADENILMIADQYGKYATFQDNNVIAVGLQKFKKGLNFGKEFGMGDLIIKYPKTPGALLARALEYSPAGILKSVYQIAKPIYEGNKIGWNHVTESFTRALIGGAGVSGIAWFLADKGILTGTGSKDYDVANLEKQSGKATYSLNTDALTRWVLSGFNPQAAEVQKGDHFVTYNWAQPIATGISIGANANQNVKQTGEFNLGQAATGAVGGALDTMVEQSVLQGVKKAFTSYPGQTTGDKLMDIAGDLPSSFVPTFSNQVRQLSDNTARSTYDPSKLQSFINRAKNKVPGAASDLPPSYDTLGHKQEVYQGKSNTLFNVLLNPAFVSRYNPSPEAKMVLDIINSTGDTSVAPRVAQKYFMIAGEKHDLTPKQYAEYQRMLGEEVRSRLQPLLLTADTTDPEELGKQVNKILDKAGRDVREYLKIEFR